MSKAAVSDNGDLPDGFAIQPPAGEAATTPSANTGGATGSWESDGLPEGFHRTDASGHFTTPQETGSMIPVAIDKFKSGITATMAMPAIATDIAQAGLDAASTGANYILNKLGGKTKIQLGNAPDKENFGGYKMSKRGLDMLMGVKGLKDPLTAYGGESTSNKYIGKIAEYLGGMAIPGAGPIVSAERKALTAITEVLGTTLSATSSVEGREVGEHLAPTLGLTKQQAGDIGEMAAGMMGPKGIGLAGQGIAKATQFARQGAEKMNFTGMSAEAQRDAAKILMMADLNKAIEANPTSKENVARAIAIQKHIEDFQPNAAQATGAPGVIAMTKEVAKSSPEALAKSAAVDARNTAAIERFKEKSFPASAQDVNQAARAKLSVDQGVRQAELDNVDRQLTALSDKYQRTLNNDAVGEQLRTLYWEKKGIAQERNTKALAGVYSTAKKYDIQEDMTGVRDTIKKIMNSDRETFQNVPGTWSKILREYPEASSPVVERVKGANGVYRNVVKTAGSEGKSTASFEEVHSLYKETNREWMDAVAGGDMAKARQLSIVKDKLSQQIGKYNDPKYGELAQKFSNFNKDYAKYAKTFRQGAGGEIGKMTRNGYSRDAEDIVGKTILQAGDKKKGVQDFFDVYGRDEQAAKLLHDGILDNFSKAAITKEGDFNPKLAAAWLKRNEASLSELPTLKAKLTGIKDEGGSLLNRRLELEQQRKIMDRTVLAKVAREAQPEKLIAAGMQDPKIFKAMLVGAHTPESKKAIARSIVEMATAKNDSFNYVIDNEKTLKPVMDALGKDHWNNLKTIAEAEMIANRVKTPGNVELSKIQDPAEQLIGTSGKGLLSRGMNVAKGYMSKPYAIADIAGRLIYKTRTEEMARLREVALFDPDMSKALATVVRGARPPAKALLDLKRIAFASGIDIGVQATTVAAKSDTDRRAGKLPVDNPDEGIGKWKSSR